MEIAGRDCSTASPAEIIQRTLRELFVAGQKGINSWNYHDHNRFSAQIVQKDRRYKSLPN